jgi:hypothetical protein
VLACGGGGDVAMVVIVQIVIVNIVVIMVCLVGRSQRSRVITESATQRTVVVAGGPQGAGGQPRELTELAPRLAPRRRA